MAVYKHKYLVPEFVQRHHQALEEYLNKIKTNYLASYKS